jgi:glucokinase
MLHASLASVNGVGDVDMSVIALDVGGTSIKAAIVDESGAMLRRTDARTPVSGGADAIVSAIRAVADELTSPEVAAVGVVVPGVVDAASGIARYSVNLGWRDIPLGALLTADLGLPVAVEHDVHAAGLAERTFGRARGVSDCLVVVIGTGIAAVVVAGGDPVRGALGIAGEIGHVPVYPDGEPCGCGLRGCAEVYASAAAIARRYAARGGEPLTAAEICARLGSDHIADAVWNDATSTLGLALATYTLLLDPSLIVLAGGLSAAGAALRDPVRAALATHLAWRAAPAVEVSLLTNRAGLFGAALLAWRAAGRDVGPGWTV